MKEIEPTDDFNQSAIKKHRRTAQWLLINKDGEGL